MYTKITDTMIQSVYIKKGSRDMTQTFRDQVIGTWSLIDYTRENKEGERYHPLGKDAIGYLMYTPDGYLSATLSRAGREFQNYSDLGDLHTGTLPEMAEAANSYHAYTGRFEVDEASQTLYHHMEMSLVPNRIGQVQDRVIQIKNNEILITSQNTSSVIRWRRADDNTNNLRQLTN